MSEIVSGPNHFVQIRGSDDLFKIIQKIGYQYMSELPSVGLPLCKSTSLEGYKTVIDGSADIGLASSELPEELIKWAAKQQVDYTKTLIAYDALAVVVNPLNPIKNLSMMDLKEIFSGRITHWKSFGWEAGGGIQVLSHESGRGSFVAWKKFVMGDKEHVTLVAKVFNDNRSLISELTKNPHAIGYLSSIPANENKLNILMVNGIPPSVEAITKCQYPICRELHLISRVNPSADINQFIQYCLLPNKGQAIIRQMGIAPIG